MSAKSFDGKARVEDVVAAYRLLLRRDPDAEGLAHFRDRVAKGLAIDDLVAAFTQSDEYRSRVASDAAVTEVDCGDYKVLVRRGERDFGAKIAASHSWEPHIVATIRRLLREGDTFVDIGANVGVMAFAGARTVGASGTVIAVEPNADNLQMLYGGILRNGFRHVRVLPFAASDGEAIFSLEGGTSNTHLAAAAEGKALVQAVSLDAVLGELPALHVVKIDIEGHEPRAIAGFRRNLEHHRPRMLVEFNPRCLRDNGAMDPRGCLDALFDLLGDVQAIDYAGNARAMTSAAETWSYWEARNREAVRTGLLPDGMLHFDLLGRVR